ncbi:unnamed protein product [Natator depressus]
MSLLRPNLKKERRLQSEDRDASDSFICGNSFLRVYYVSHISCQAEKKRNKKKGGGRGHPSHSRRRRGGKPARCGGAGRHKRGQLFWGCGLRAEVGGSDISLAGCECVCVCALQGKATRLPPLLPSLPPPLPLLCPARPPPPQLL